MGIEQAAAAAVAAKDYPFLLRAKQLGRRTCDATDITGALFCRFSTRRQTQIFAAACSDRRRGSPDSAEMLGADVTNQERKSMSNASSGELRALVLQSQEKKIIIVNEGDKTPERSTISCTVRKKESLVKDKKKQYERL